jgi:hypothetical protein
MKSKIIAAAALFACLSVQAQFGSGTGSYGTIGGNTFTTVDNTTNSYVVGTLYTAPAQRGLLVGTAVMAAPTGGSAGDPVINVGYTNGSVGAFFQIRGAHNGPSFSGTNSVPFTIPLAAGATFKFNQASESGASAYITNVMFWSF